MCVCVWFYSVFKLQCVQWECSNKCSNFSTDHVKQLPYHKQPTVKKKNCFFAYTYEDRGIYVIFLVEEKIFSMKQAVTNITECGCMKSPDPQFHADLYNIILCLVHVVKISLSLVFLWPKRFNKNTAQVSLPPPHLWVCLWVGGCVWVGACV